MAGGGVEQMQVFRRIGEMDGRAGCERDAAGQAGERFAVRNSGATAVVEGVGDHGCEYMTGGRVVVLGATGRNFAAGMSGGVAYVWDPDGTFGADLNGEFVDLEECDDSDAEWLADILSLHVLETGSEVAARILADRQSLASQFARVMPRDYRRVLEQEMAMGASRG